MIIFVFVSMIVGLAAAILSLLTGFSIFAALAVYSLAGIAFLGLVVSRALICQKLQKKSSFKAMANV